MEEKKKSCCCGGGSGVARPFGDLAVKPAGSCKWDALAIGENMMRLDPGRIPTARARSADIYHGGGENNVVEGLCYCFNHSG
jgi:hypothetical protein